MSFDFGSVKRSIEQTPWNKWVGRWNRSDENSQHSYCVFCISSIFGTKWRIEQQKSDQSAMQIRCSFDAGYIDGKISFWNCLVICNKLLKLFSYFQDVLYNHSKRKGILYNKLLYRKYNMPTTRKNRKRKSRGNETTVSKDVDTVTNENDMENSMAALTLEEELDSLLFFKTCVVARNRDVLELRMKNTIPLREKTIKKHETKFFDMFPFYFVEPRLVHSRFYLSLFLQFWLPYWNRFLFVFFSQILYDFSIRFDSLNSSSLILKWPHVKNKLLNVGKKEEIAECEALNFDPLTTSFLILLRYLVNKNTFKNGVEKMILFSDVSFCEFHPIAIFILSTSI